jgi:hypothetical protein
VKETSSAGMTAFAPYKDLKISQPFTASAAVQT